MNEDCCLDSSRCWRREFALDQNLSQLARLPISILERKVGEQACSSCSIFFLILLIFFVVVFVISSFLFVSFFFFFFLSSAVVVLTVLFSSRTATPVHVLRQRHHGAVERGVR